jgi:hypothetical protein
MPLKVPPFASYDWGGFYFGGDVGWVRRCFLRPRQYSVEDKIELFSTVRARAGYAFGNWLVYDTGGFAFDRDLPSNTQQAGTSALARHRYEIRHDRQKSVRR